MKNGGRNYYLDLTPGRLKEVLFYNPKNGIFIRISTDSKKIKPGGIAGGINANGYYAISVDGRIHLAHRLAWLYMTGDYPPFDIDHINGDTSDCRFDNLREAKPHENLWNRSKQSNNKSGHKNVSWSKPANKWEVRLRRNGKQIIVGYSDNLEMAAKMAVEARIRHHREFASS
jgi:hypothetical protein